MLRAALATRAAVRFGRRLAVGSVTGGITLSDILLYITMTEEDLSPDPEPTATYYDKLPTKRALAAGDAVVGRVAGVAARAAVRAAAGDELS
uniref:Uncharacterized protein n=1 Tax=Oryza glumipatula TaxID=40148 RepID=A0A0E0B793_9ORYZ